MDNLLDHGYQTFLKNFHQEPTAIYFAPSRINVIGEHIDYNGGIVLPFAISLGTYAFVAPYKDFHFLSTNIPGEVYTTAEELDYRPEFSWGNYPLGMVKKMKEKGYNTPGFQCLFMGNIPHGAGLSSSASIEMVTGQILKDLGNHDVSPIELALLGQKVENEHFGLHSGIMDQFVIAMGKKDHAILLHTDSLSYEYLPLPLKNVEFIIMNTGKRRELVGGEYNRRREDCERALKTLQAHFHIDYLCDIKEEDLPRAEGYILKEQERKRLRHVVTENERVHKAKKAIEEQDMETLGRILNQSHRSLQVDYEVTGPELDAITETARAFPGCLGARMTGAGFSGCAIALVEKEKREDFFTHVKKKYFNETGLSCELFVATPSDGAGKLDIERIVTCQY